MTRPRLVYSEWPLNLSCLELQFGVPGRNPWTRHVFEMFLTCCTAITQHLVCLAFEKHWYCLSHAINLMNCLFFFMARWGRGFGLVQYFVAQDSPINQPNSVLGIIFYSLQMGLGEHAILLQITEQHCASVKISLHCNCGCILASTTASLGLNIMWCDLIFPKNAFVTWWLVSFVFFPLQGWPCPKKLQPFWSFPPGCQWPALSTSRQFLRLFWGTSAWCACQHTSSTSLCSSPMWNERRQLREWRRRRVKKAHLWNSTLF